MGQAASPVGPLTVSSKDYPHAELDGARVVHLRQSNRPERARGDGCLRAGEVHRVGGVEQFRTDLHGEALMEHQLLFDQRVQSEIGWVAHIRKIAADIAELKLWRSGESRRVEV